MKDRLPALDGLRGFAALSVLLSHIGANPLFFVSAPIILNAYRTLSVGPNSVQILFVLSGFLMAFLYPKIKSARGFLQKRYGRIIPVYATIVFFLWFINLEYFIKIWYLQIPALILLAALVYFFWKAIKRIPKIGKILFFSYCMLQLISLATMLLIIPHYSVSDNVILPFHIKNAVVLLSNITLTTPFVNDIPRMSLVFWSLAPEIYFYLVYPFIVIPLIEVSKKWGILVSVVIIVSVTKILFDLDKEIVSIAALQSMNIARASGFVAGVTIGTIYQTKGTTWNKISPIIKHPVASILAIVLLIGMQWGDWAIRDGQSVTFMNFYYLATSWIIAFIILNGIIPNSLIYKIFSKKFVVFLGIISYSIYLIHPQIIAWVGNFITTLKPFNLPSGVRDFYTVFGAVFLTIGIAYILFRLIEFLYFSSKKTVLVTTLAKEGEGDAEVKKFALIRHPIIKIAAVVLIFFYLYTGTYSPTQLVARAKISPSILPFNEKSILHSRITIPFTATYDNLSEASIYMRYAKSAGETISKQKKPAILEFRLLDSSGKQLYISQRKAYIVEGSPRFGFGFPTIANSKGKLYKAELRLLNGSPTDQILVDTTPMSFVSIYTTSKQTLLHTPWIYLLNRLLFVFADSGFVFAGIFVLLIVMLIRFEQVIRNQTGDFHFSLLYIPNKIRLLFARE